MTIATLPTKAVTKVFASAAKRIAANKIVAAKPTLTVLQVYPTAFKGSVPNALTLPIVALGFLALTRTNADSKHAAQTKIAPALHTAFASK